MASPARRIAATRPTARLETAVRVFTTRQSRPRDEADEAAAETSKPARVKRTYPHEALVFDCETLPGPAQRLRFLVWRLYRDPHDRAACEFCVEEGIAYPDLIPRESPAGFAVLEPYARDAVPDVAAGFPGR